jgi:hypothetical protein
MYSHVQNADYIEDKTITDTHKISTPCSICKEAGSTDKNPLLKLCQCDQLTHFYCQVRHMANLTKRVTTSNVVSLYCTHFECQVEKANKAEPGKDQAISSFPAIVMYNSKPYTLYDIGRPDHGDYIVLENLSIPQELSRITHVFIPSLANNEITIVCADIGKRLKRRHKDDRRACV